MYVSTRQTHMHRHLHGGPLQTHSTACTALLEKTAVHFRMEGARHSDRQRRMGSFFFFSRLPRSDSTNEMFHHTNKLITSHKGKKYFNFRFPEPNIQESPPHPPFPSPTQPTLTHSLTYTWARKHTDWGGWGGGGAYITAHACTHERHFLTELCLQA